MYTLNDSRCMKVGVKIHTRFSGASGCDLVLPQVMLQLNIVFHEQVLYYITAGIEIVISEF